MPANTGKHILIVGTGSVGKRHAKNLHALGCVISCFDPNAGRCAELAGEIELRGSYTEFDRVLEDARSFQGVVIASPPKFHVDQCLRLQAAGLPVLLEKPVSPAYEDARRLRDAETRSPLLLGYTWRWWKPLHRVRELLAQRAVGEIHHVRMSMSAHLADWHPWEDYRSFFMASRDLGGGALLDESHWIDLMLWFFGRPTHVFAQIAHISPLEIETDDNVDMLVTYPRTRVSIHLDLYGRPHEKRIVFCGDGGTIAWTVDPNRVCIGKKAADEWEVEPFTVERNDMFLDTAREFLGVIDGSPVRTCTIGEGIDVLRVVEAARRSSSTGQSVQLDWGHEL